MLKRLEIVVKSSVAKNLLVEGLREGSHFVTDLCQRIIKLVAELEFVINTASLYILMPEPLSDLAGRRVFEHRQDEVLYNLGSKLWRNLLQVHIPKILLNHCQSPMEVKQLKAIVSNSNCQLY